jgi:hypothetical protein
MNSLYERPVIVYREKAESERRVQNIDEEEAMYAVTDIYPHLSPTNMKNLKKNDLPLNGINSNSP